jgi:hypothetical protein
MGIDRRAQYRSALAAVALLALTEAFYLRPGILLGTSALAGVDYGELHIRRIRFAREALFGIWHTLPAWYPHEALGSPFTANLQSFPWIPTRLLLLPLDPSVAYAAAIAMAAALSAIFTYLYCRRAGLTRTGAVAAGGTFACAGYFASRVLAGHLPLLEAYPALPLLLWLVDRALAPERAGRRRFDLGVLAFGSACVVAAGHPQLPAYSVASALLYTAYKGRSGLRARVAGVITLGACLTLAVWWPMLLLIGRSTRMLPLSPPDNDVAMPYSRLLALVIPGIHGWPEPVELADHNPFTGFPNRAYFWDTASYVGILPLVAIAALLIGCVVRKRMPDGRWRFLSCLGVGAFLCSLPLASPLLHLLPGTLLRSPARLLYISTFCAAVALGAGADAVRHARWPRPSVFRNGLLVVGLSVHFLDLGGFTHWFIQVSPRERRTPEFEAILDRELGAGRIAEERGYQLFSDGSNDDRYDDAGGFDSIFLARFYQGFVLLAGSPPGLNRQWIDASKLPVKALEATGVRFVITTETRMDLELASSTDDANLYQVANPAARADFFAEDRAAFVAERQIPELFAANPRNKLLLPPDAKKYLPRGGGSPRIAHDSAIHQVGISYSRPSSDEIVLLTGSDEPGFVHVLEAYDPGWSATVDGAGAVVVPANGFVIAVPVPAGSHTVRLRYDTPGRALGEGLSLLSFGLLAVLIASAKPSRPICLHLHGIFTSS